MFITTTNIYIYRIKLKYVTYKCNVINYFTTVCVRVEFYFTDIVLSDL